MSRKAVWIYLADFTCFACGKGFYPGYAGVEVRGRPPPATLPCTKCGHTMPGKVEDKSLRLVIAVRDAALEQRRKGDPQ